MVEEEIVQGMTQVCQHSNKSVPLTHHSQSGEEKDALLHEINSEEGKKRKERER